MTFTVTAVKFLTPFIVCLKLVSYCSDLKVLVVTIDSIKNLVGRKVN
jgi:hypothetical protein